MHNENISENPNEQTVPAAGAEPDTAEYEGPAYSAEKLEPVTAKPAADEEGGEPEDGEGKEKGKKKRKPVAVVYDYVETFCYALALMMVFFLFIFRYVSVDGDSMRETLHDNDKLIISNLFYTPRTGDIVVLNPEDHKASDQPIIKRVIATGGQTVFIDFENWEITVDGVKLDEPYIQAMRAQYGENVRMNTGNNPRCQREFTVEEGRVFVMGDNRNNSHDSRYVDYGEIGVNRILGRVLLRIYPNFGSVE